MRPSARRLVLAAAALLPAVGLALVLFSCRRASHELATPEDLLAALRDAGLEYEACRFAPGSTITEPGTYLRRIGDPRPWEELASQEQAAHPERWTGYLRVRAVSPAAEATEAPHCRRLGGLLLVGDPAEIERIGEALR